MPDFILTLGGVDFQDFEVPDSIKAGGKQALSVHKYPGGIRTVDTSGPDDNPIAWSGTFLDGNAELRCQQLDTMRRQGSVVPVTWSSYSYLVIVESFDWDFKRFYQIPYSISLTVAQDQTQPFSGDDQDVEDQIQSDISDAVSDASGFALGITSGLSAAVATVQNTVGTVASVSGASIGFLTGLQDQVETASGIASGVLSQTDAAMSAAGAAVNFASGTPPETMIANVGNLVLQSSALPLAFDAANKLTRLGKNIAAVAG